MKVLRGFGYSRDGYTTKGLAPGDDPADVPAEYIPGLLAEGYLGDGAPEAKVIEGAPEVGEPVERDAYPDLSEAQEKALDRDGDGKPGGSRGRPKKKA